MREMNDAPEKWGAQTLESLWLLACIEPTGIFVSSLRLEGKQRIAVAACFTKRADIERLMDVYLLRRFPKIQQDWSRIRLVDMMTLAHSGSGFVAVFKYDAASVEKALLLIAAEPDSITKLCSLMSMPN
jgi:hypothetical protein